MKKLALSVVLVNLLAGCGAIHTPFDWSSAPKHSSATPPAEAPKVDTATSADVNAKALDTTDTPAVLESADAAPVAQATAAVETPPKAESSDAAKEDPLNDPASPLAKRSVFFAFDADAIQDADKATIEAHGAYLASHPDKKVRAEGNADERGSSEYNLALGQRRANHTKKALALAGAKIDQIESISYGEEKPLATGHDETSWAQNRRTDINYK